MPISKASIQKFSLLSQKAAALFYWNGSAVVILKSQNISSITRTSIGIYQITLNSGMNTTGAIISSISEVQNGGGTDASILSITSGTVFNIGLTYNKASPISYDPLNTCACYFEMYD